MASAEQIVVDQQQFIDKLRAGYFEILRLRLPDTASLEDCRRAFERVQEIADQAINADGDNTR